MDTYCDHNNVYYNSSKGREMFQVHICTILYEEDSLGAIDNSRNTVQTIYTVN